MWRAARQPTNAAISVGDHGVQERRDAPRTRKVATGKILFDSTVLDCAILDLSDRGACLELSTTERLPSDFALTLTDGNKRQCKVVWKEQDRVGVEFC